MKIILYNIQCTFENKFVFMSFLHCSFHIYDCFDRTDFSLDGKVNQLNRQNVVVFQHCHSLSFFLTSFPVSGPSVWIFAIATTWVKNSFFLAIYEEVNWGTFNMKSSTEKYCWDLDLLYLKKMWFGTFKGCTIRLSIPIHSKVKAFKVCGQKLLSGWYVISILGLSATAIVYYLCTCLVLNLNNYWNTHTHTFSE